MAACLSVNMSDVSFSTNEALNAVLKSALMKTTGSMTVTDNMLSGTGEVDLQKLVMEASRYKRHHKCNRKSVARLEQFKYDDAT
ncbi:hypothetical protein [Alteromonas gracilis]|uniref:hypothetical protein n=1 Tax=Alteromonas gracilis TaxID=1479524 RepID=UPI00321A17EB